MAGRGALVVGRDDFVGPQDDVDRDALRQVERDRQVGVPHAAGDVRGDLHADGLGAPPGRDQDGGILGEGLEPLQRARTAGLGGDGQSAAAVFVADQDDAAPAQFGHGALDGCERRCRTGMDLTRNHAFLYHGRGFCRSEPLFPLRRSS